MTAPTRASLAGLIVSAGLAAACSNGATEAVDCHRYDAAALNEDNSFAATVPPGLPGVIDTRREHLEISLSMLAPVRDAVELVHVVGGIETDRWVFSFDTNQDAARCWVSPEGGPTTCGAAPLGAAYRPAGYYYLRANGNTVIEAGLSFTLCR